MLKSLEVVFWGSNLVGKFKTGIMENELERFNGKEFRFAGVFSCVVDNGEVLIEQYCEGKCLLDHIRTEDQFMQLYEILTGKKFYFDNLI